MAASAADIRSALSIPESSTPTAPQPKKSTTTTRKPEGISRELYSLIGPSAPSLAAQLAKPRLKQKPKFGAAGSKVKWELRAFKNPARSDSLELRHWEKVTPDGPGEYPFAKYNVQPNTYTYTQDEYTRFLEDKEWSKEETDYLFNLVRDYDSRWYIIHDRYEYPNGPPRSLEDLRDRYYSVCRKLIRHRPWAGDELAKAALVSSFQFDKDREVMRKKYIMSLENRSQDQIAEEEALYVEVKRLEQNERRFKRDREALLRILAGIDSGLPDIQEDDGVPLGITGDPTAIRKNKKKGGQTTDLESPATPSVPSVPTGGKRPHTTKNAAYDLQHCITRTEVPTSGVATKAAHQPAYLRSFKLPTPKAAIAPKISQSLAELGITHTRLVMPTRENVQRLEALMEAATSLVETKRMVDKADYEIEVTKQRMALREPSQSGDGEGRVEGGDSMEIEGSQMGDGENEEGEDGRGQSVISARSGRGRKHVSRFFFIER
ncbi:hypothetical protein CVT26_010714 [Gymnopilus dilepis]|uniref:SWR1-complex protein 4 n=1 Tax=Gymnopilus dilepis TaxID=231916 RepID=A0A409VI32_9AGAR|nr:hypothetical protein CVT26_010714 [Gymnopilus dilepis]